MSRETAVEDNYATYREIKSQTLAWENALESTRAVAGSLRQLTDSYQQVLFTGCGSTYYLSLAAAAMYQELAGKLAWAVPGGELLLNPQTALADDQTLLVAISRSGSTTETIKAVEKFKRDQRGVVIAITNYGDQPLAGLADIAIVIEKGQEESVAQTRSFASMYMAATAFCALAARRDDLLDAMSSLPGTGMRLMQEYETSTRQIGENLTFDRFYFLGSGIRYGLACECNLKMKEMTLTHSEPFHFLEFRHGPMSMVNEKAVIVGLLSDMNRSHEQTVLNEMRERGSTILAVSEADGDVVFHSNIAESVRGILYLPALQLMAFYRSLAKGLNPDRPKNLTAVVRLDL